jgi:hypothetical protein
MTGSILPPVWRVDILPVSRGALFRLTAAVGIIVILGVVMCVFGGHETGGLCLISLVLLASPLALSPLPVVGRLESRRALSYPSLRADRPSPPPKS